MNEILIIGIISYLVTGLALTGYDFSAPAIHRKVYVIKKDYKMAAITCFTWPYFAMYEAYQESRLGRSWVRFIFGVIFLASGMFFWGRFIFQIMDTFVGIIWFNAFVTLIFLILSSPIITSITMPEHGTNSKRHLAQINEKEDNGEDFSFYEDYDSNILDEYAKGRTKNKVVEDYDVWFSKNEQSIKGYMTDMDYESFTKLMKTDKEFNNAVKELYVHFCEKGYSSSKVAGFIAIKNKFYKHNT